MSNLVIALSGGIGAGKAALGQHLATALDADRVSFGSEVRRYAEAVGADPRDIASLQQVGQALVLHQRCEFVQRVLEQRRRTDATLIVEGVRHVEVLFELQAQTKAASLRVVHIDTPRDVRYARVIERGGVERRQVMRFAADINEAQVDRVLPQYADLRIHGDLPIALQVARVAQAFDLAVT